MLEPLEHPISINLEYIEPRHVFSLLDDSPFLFLGGSGRYNVLALETVEVEKDEVFSRKISAVPKQNDHSVFQLGYIGALQYLECDEDEPEGFIYKVLASMVWDKVERKCSLVYSRFLDEPKWRSLISKVEKLKSVSRERADAFPVIGRNSNLNLIPSSTDDSYLESVSDCIERIKNGQFYQLNLLRFFKLSTDFPEAQLTHQFMEKGGPFSAFFQLEDERLISFSPERFVRIHREQDKDRIIMEPIKGTMSRTENDEQQISALLKSAKDQAELSIIIDLARNDLHSVCEPHSVKVLNSCRLESFPTVHHLVADVAGTLRSTSSFSDIFQKILPAASITGAPKKEVRLDIRRQEGRARGYFMGNIFYWDPYNSLFDSSVLIRTLHGRKTTNRWTYEYAAGSGIVAKSEPEVELGEVFAKTNVLRPRLQDQKGL